MAVVIPWKYNNKSTKSLMEVNEQHLYNVIMTFDLVGHHIAVTINVRIVLIHPIMKGLHMGLLVVR